MEVKEQQEILNTAENLSSPLNYNVHEIAIILAAGHGKRIKSQRSKMLHKIWGVPTVERVYNACRNGSRDINIILVVGIKAKDVMEVVGTRSNWIRISSYSKWNRPCCSSCFEKD